MEKPEAVVEAETQSVTQSTGAAVSPGGSLKAAALGKPVSELEETEEPSPSDDEITEDVVTKAEVERSGDLDEEPPATQAGPSVPGVEPKAP
ncbi:MAG TPA: hypothetical protein VFD83_05890, partial [Candidatus Polarisedimenticolia bacterium]|nr:hypothetical protein [Candidatus Polarisedimenticolia bacterium]